MTKSIGFDSIYKSQESTLKIGGRMINIHIPTSIEYDTTNASLLASTIKNVNSIDKTSEWNKEAKVEVGVLNLYLKTIEEKTGSCISGYFTGRRRA